MHFYFFLCCCCLIACNSNSDDQAIQPNIIYILADDLGYGELGVYGQEIIETPHLDQLAREGMIFSQHYTAAPVCAPARAMLMTGMHSGHAIVRGNDEQADRGDVWNFKAMLDDPSLEGQRPLPDSIITIAELLQTAGYTTACLGKWGLGAPESAGAPNAQGFDYFYGYNCQRQAHNLFPTHLWENKERHYLNNELQIPHQERQLEDGQSEADYYAGFHQEDYAPQLIHEAALEFLVEHQDEPFFMYYASPLPHVPLQAPHRWVNYYKNKLGTESPYNDRSYFPNATPRATYAAMISYLDEQVGELVEQLKTLGIYENTLIIFTSDNGPTYTGGADTPFFDSAKPFRTDYGRGKGFLYEGGIRVPMIAHWKGHISAGSKTDHLSAIYDVFPTICELTEINPPLHDGRSFLPTLLGQQQEQPPYLYWEFPEYNGQQAVRMGPWKGIRKDLHDGNLELELYNLSADLREENNLAREEPAIIQQILEIMDQEHQTSPYKRFQIEVLGDK